MRRQWFEWQGARDTALAARAWAEDESGEEVTAEVLSIGSEVRERRDDAVRELTARFDATERLPESLRVDDSELPKALATLDPEIRDSLELAIENVRRVAEAQVDFGQKVIDLAQGQTVVIREVPVGAAGIYAPGGTAVYPSSVIMCAIPAQVAGVERIALASPPRPDGHINEIILAAAALCDIGEVYSMGGAQAIFALAYGTETVGRVDVIAGPGNSWVQEAKRNVFGFVGIDSFAGPSELMVIAGSDIDVEWAALDLCAQAEHGESSPLLVAGVDGTVLEELEAAAVRAAAERPGVSDSPLALVHVPGLGDAIDLANAFVPEHLEIFDEDASRLAEQVRTAGCVFVGRYGATAFGDYAAGSNHVLPTIGAGRFAGPLGPGIFRRKISTVEVSAEAAAKLAPHVDVLARAEGFPVHGESAMIRTKS
jgi:histidinol dehydrogenase